MVTGGNNCETAIPFPFVALSRLANLQSITIADAKQSGGEVVTAYAPDTVIDYLLLRHEPRFAYYSRFFHAMAEVSEDLMSVRTIPDSQVGPSF